MKTLFKVVAVLIILLIIVVAGSLYFLGTIVKTGVEKAGPKVTKTDVKLSSAKLSVFSGYKPDSCSYRARHEQEPWQYPS